MKPMNSISTKGNAWKCAAGCFGICLADTASPILDVAGIAASTISANA